MFKRRGDMRTNDVTGVWGGAIGFQCPWAHPVWSEYVLQVYDLLPHKSGESPMVKYHPDATHEFVLNALKQEVRIDFKKSLFDQELVMLMPINHGYQFKADNNGSAWERVKGLVDACEKLELSPDSDFVMDWDNRMIDGWTMRVVR
jgi:hypothetical protein